MRLFVDVEPKAMAGAIAGWAKENPNSPAKPAPEAVASGAPRAPDANRERRLEPQLVVV